MRGWSNEQRLGLIGIVVAVATIVSALLFPEGRRFVGLEGDEPVGLLPADVEEALESFREYKELDAAYVVVGVEEATTERYGDVWCLEVSETDEWGYLTTNVYVVRILGSEIRSTAVFGSEDTHLERLGCKSLS